MRALVTGGAGYFGELLVQRLAEQDCKVRVFDLNRPSTVLPGVEAVQGDIRDPRAVAEACLNVDVVFHNVAQVPLARDKNLFWSVNRDGTRTLLRACADRRVSKLIYTSSSAVFGAPKSNPVTEETEPAPAEDYGRAKLSGEHACREYWARGLDVSIIRPRTIMGHGRLGIFQILFEWIYQGSNVPVLNGGTNIYQFVHAADLADACIRASCRQGPDVYNCGTDRFGSMRQVLENLCAFAGTGSRVISLPMRPFVIAMNLCSALGVSPLGAYHSLMYGRSMYFNISKAQRELDWQPLFSNDEMFIESYCWYVKNRENVLHRSTGVSHHQSAVRQGALAALRLFL
jgi:nucleoside-diphosphate-sugar epimerase